MGIIFLILIAIAVILFFATRKTPIKVDDHDHHKDEEHHVATPPSPPGDGAPSEEPKHEDKHEKKHEEKHADEWKGLTDMPLLVKLVLGIAIGFLLLFMFAPKGVRTIHEKTIVISDGDEYVVPVSKQAMHIDVSAPVKVFAGTSPTDGEWYRETPTYSPQVDGDVTYIKYKAYPHTTCTISYSQ
jgi:hypothetical protein